MATVKVSENYSRAKSGKPPVGNFKPRQEMSRNPTVKRSFPAGSAPSGKPPVKHHVASKAVKTGLKATPQGRAASTALQAKGKTGGKSVFKGSSFATKLPKTDKRTSSFIGKAVNHSPLLVAEFIGGLVIIAVAFFTRTATEKYQDVATSVMARFTAFTAVFFILFLMSSGSKRSSQAAAWFGLIMDLGLLFDATNHNMFEDVSAFINGTGLPAKTVTVSDTKPEEFFATADIKDSTQQGGIVQSGASTPSAATPPGGSTAKPASTNPNPTGTAGNRGSSGTGTGQLTNTPGGLTGG